MSVRVRIIVSIVISAVLLGMVISYLKRRWMPTEVFDWAMWVAMALVGAYAIYRIATLSKAWSNNDKDKE